MDTCKPEWNERLSAWFDGEADAAEARATQVHLRSCLCCRRVLEGWEELRGRLRVGQTAGGRVRPTTAGSRRSPSSSRRRAVAMVSGVAALVIALVATGAFAALNRHPSSLLDELEQHHFQAFAKASPCEFQSSDPQAVQSWLHEKVGYAVEVPALEGATLLGARRCKLDGVLSASLLFRRGDSAVTLFIPPPNGTVPARLAQLTEGEGRCTVGRLGERICSSHQPGALAVANADDSTLISYADAVAAAR